MATAVQLRYLPLLLALLLAGCASVPDAGAPGGDPSGGDREDRLQRQEDQLTPDAEPVEPAPDAAAAVDDLQSRALAAQAGGDWNRAAALLGRALRIDGERGELYLQIAEVRLGQGRFAAAEQVARRGLSVSTDDPARASALWRVIAQARSARGDTGGAREARRRADDLEAGASQ